MSTMLKTIPKLPMRNIEATKQFYCELLGFSILAEYGKEYLLVEKDSIELHFFLFPELSLKENYGMCYIRVSDIENLYRKLSKNDVPIPSLGHLETKPWGQKEFSIIDADNNLLTFGETI